MKLQPYIDYKESEIEWLKRIPKYWEVNRIKDIAFLKSGDTVTSSQLIDPPGFPVYGGNGFRGYFEDYNLEGHYILIGRQGALCGNINLAKGKFWASEHAIVVHSTKKWEMIWFSELLSSMNLNQYSLSAAQPGLSVETIRQLKIPFPPLPEQTRIAKYLDRQTQLIDRKIELLQRKRDYYEELKQALINETVCRGLDKNAPLKDSGVEWIGKVPAHWEVKRLKDVADLKFSNVDKKSYEDQDEVELCNYVDVYKNDFIDESIQFMKATASTSEIARFQLKLGDVLVTKDSESFDDIANPALVKLDRKHLICGYHLAMIRAKKNILTGAFLFRLLQSDEYNYAFSISATGITRVGLGISDFNDAKIILPPIVEQEAITAFIDAKSSLIDKTRGNISDQIDTLQELRRTLINDVVTGKVRVPETD